MFDVLSISLLYVLESRRIKERKNPRFRAQMLIDVIEHTFQRYLNTRLARDCHNTTVIKSCVLYVYVKM
jgi:hypothetical protein